MLRLCVGDGCIVRNFSTAHANNMIRNKHLTNVKIKIVVLKSTIRTTNETKKQNVNHKQIKNHLSSYKLIFSITVTCISLIHEEQAQYLCVCFF